MSSQNFQSFTTEINLYKTKSQENLDALKKLIDFYRIYVTVQENQVKDFEEKIETYEKNTTLAHESILLTNCQGIYDSYKQTLLNLKVILTKIDRELVNPLEEFRTNQFHIYQENVNGLRKLNQDYQDIKKQLEKAKLLYYQKSEDVNKVLEKYNIINTNNDNDNINNTNNNNNFSSIISKEINGSNVRLTQNDKDKIIKIKMEAKNCEKIYTFELYKYNKNIEMLNMKYKKLTENIKKKEESRVYLIKTAFDKYKHFISEYIKNLNDYLNIIETYCSDDILQKDKKYQENNIDQFLYDKNEGIRINNEKFVSYNEYIESKQTETLNIDSLKIQKEFEEFNIKDYIEVLEYELNNGSLNALNTLNILNTSNALNTSNTSNSSNSSDNNKISNKTGSNNDNNTNELNFMISCLDDLLSDNEISLTKLAILLEQIKNRKIDFDKRFLNFLYDRKGKSSMKLTNFQNLEHLGFILGTITLIHSDIFTSNFQLNFKIIYLSERTYYLNKTNNNKVYLCAILSKNKYYKTKEFWKNFIELKLSHLLSDHILRLKEAKLNKDKATSFFGKIGNAFKNMNEKREEIIAKSIIKNTRLSKLIKEFTTLDTKIIIIIDKMATQEMNTLIRDCISNFTNFNFPSDVCLDMIAELCQEYKIPKENINYFVICYNVNNFTIRKLLNFDYFGGKKSTNKQDKLIISNIKELDPKQRNAITRKIFKFCIPYLKPKDYINIYCLNKKYNQSFKKNVYKYILKRQNLDKKTRINIWEDLLHIKELKKKYNYHNILNSLNDEKTKHEIFLDVIRTDVLEKKPSEGDKKSNEEGRNSPQEIEIRDKLVNILYAISSLNGNIKYCQGMNFVVQFIYEFSKDEEETFYIFLSFFLSTDYSLIFAKDLEKLKIFFYIFKKILNLLEPELNSYFNSNGIDTNFFLSSWLITLFTGSHQHFLSDKDNNMNILLRVLDNFILFGWKAMFEVGCVALHYNEKTLLNLKYEDMMKFLINDLLKNEFFSNINKEYLETFLNNRRITSKIMKNIEAEYSMNEKLKEKKD